CGDTHVIGDAVFGIGMVAAHEIELVVAAVTYPSIYQAVIEPCSPTTLKRHTQVCLDNAEPNAPREENEIDQRQHRYGVGVFVLETIEDCSIPEVHCIGCSH